MDTALTGETLQTDTHLGEGIQEVSNGLLLVELLHVLPLLWHRCSSFKKNGIYVENAHGPA